MQCIQYIVESNFVYRSDLFSYVLMGKGNICKYHGDKDHGLIVSNRKGITYFITKDLFSLFVAGYQ